MNTDKLNEYPNSKENEKDLANKILDFYDRYDPYWSFGTANDDLASTIMQLKNSDTRQKLIDNLQRIIATEKKAPCMSSNSFISLAEQLKNEITNYGMEILDTSKKNIMEENTTENQSNIYNQEENLFNGFSEDEINLAQKLFNFESNYDPYGFADKIAEQGDLNYLANEVHSLRNENERQDIINYLQEIIDNADKEPLISTEHVVSCAKQLMEDIAVYYDREIIDTTKTNIMEENTMENQSTAKFFNKHSYGEIENKAFLSCDAKTAYEIGQKAQEQGVTFSAKYDGDKSAVVVDGVKDKAFVNEVRAEFNLSDKLDEVENVTEKIADALDSGEIDIERDTQSIDNQAR